MNDLVKKLVKAVDPLTWGRPSAITDGVSSIPLGITDTIETLRARVKELEEELESALMDLSREVSIGNDYMERLAAVTKGRDAWRNGSDVAHERLNELATDWQVLHAENARLREALIDFSKVAPQVVSCNDFHHVKKDRHEFDQPCPVTARYFAALEAVTQALAGESK